VAPEPREDNPALADTPQRTAVAMSGGVDSAVAAMLLRDAGHDVVGVFMRFRPAVPSPTIQPSDPSHALAVARALGIHLEVFDFTDQLEALVHYFCHAYDTGQTPNPCVLCNKWVKFGRLFQCARELGAERLATGHYVRLTRARGRYILRRARDEAKDQSYLLCGLSQPQLAAALFPLGGYRKDEVRRLARQRGIPTHQRPESQDICFVAEGGHGSLLRERLGDRIEPGPILDTAGNTLGRHPGCQFFTIGQRRGLRVALGTPRYVVAINRRDNSITVGTREELYCAGMRVTQINWIAFDKPPSVLDALVQVRYNHQPVRALVEPDAYGGARVTFRTPEAGVAPGQVAVFYDGDIVLGGGIIERSWPVERR